DVSKRIIRLNPILTTEARPKLLEALCHEAAHIAVQERFGKVRRPHGVEWQSQNRTSQQSEIGQSLRHHRERGIGVHLFVRKEKRTPAGGAAPFIYCGELEFMEWKGVRPITIRWRLLSPLPGRLLRLISLSAGKDPLGCRG